MSERLSYRIKRGLKQIPGLSGQKNRQVHVFFWLACFILLLSVFNYTIASALFLQHLGTVSLPVSYIIIGCLTLPLYSAFARVVDAYPRPQLLKLVVLLTAFLALGIRLGLVWEIKALYFVLYISAYFLWGILQDLFTSLAYDYFTILEVKQLFSRWGVGMALGEVLAALLSAILVSRIGTENLLLILPLLGGLIMVPLHLIQTKFRPIVSTEADDEEAANFQEAIKNLGRLGKRYWIIPFLVGSIFLHAVLYCLGEFLYFQVYVDRFTSEQQLTQFLAMMRGLNNVIQIVLLTLVTQPLLQRIKVGWLNLIYPLLNLLVFAGLRWQFSLPTAMLVNAHNDAFYEGLDKPVLTLNYNAVPYRYLGRIQSLVGVFDALGLVLAGIILALPLVPVQLTELALGLSALFLLLRYGMGKGYSRSLLALLRTGTIETAAMPEEQVDAVHPYHAVPCDQNQLHQLLEPDAANCKLSTRIDQLYDCLRPDYAVLFQTLIWLHRLPNTKDYQLLKSAISDSHQRLLQQVRYCLNRLGDDPVRQVLLPRLQDADLRLRAKAIELLLASPYKSLIVPLLPLFYPLPETYPALSPQEIVQAAQQAEDAWIRLAAQMLTQQSRLQPIYQVRALHLKQWSFFATLSLDQIHTLTADFKVYTYPAEAVFVLAEPAFYLIYAGQCVILTEQIHQKSSPPPDQVSGTKPWLMRLGDRLTLRATQATTLLQLPQEHWEALTTRYPELRNRL
jgi:hypothetical protein